MNPWCQDPSSAKTYNIVLRQMLMHCTQMFLDPLQEIELVKWAHIWGTWPNSTSFLTEYSLQ